MGKRVAEIRIKQWEPLDIEIAGQPDQRIKVGQRVGVVLPEIWIKDRKMPNLIVDLEVRKPEDEGQLRDFYFIVMTELESYKDFWKRRKKEAESGIFLQ